jgi:hypothetical protein
MGLGVFFKLTPREVKFATQPSILITVPGTSVKTKPSLGINLIAGFSEKM